MYVHMSLPFLVTINPNDTDIDRAILRERANVYRSPD